MQKITCLSFVFENRCGGRMHYGDAVGEDGGTKSGGQR